MANRDFTTRRSAIRTALVVALKEIDGNDEYLTNLYENVKPKLIFWDEVNEFPMVCVTTGLELREYQPAGFKWRFLTVTIRAYVKTEDPEEQLEKLLEDIEVVLENNGNLTYYDNTGATKNVADLDILSVDTDEGALAPLGVGEIICQLRY